MAVDRQLLESLSRLDDNADFLRFMAYLITLRRDTEVALRDTDLDRDIYRQQGRKRLLDEIVTLAETADEQMRPQPGLDPRLGTSAGTF